MKLLYSKWLEAGLFYHTKNKVQSLSLTLFQEEREKE
jgi:hypothetical protein